MNITKPKNVRIIAANIMKIYRHNLKYFTTASTEKEITSDHGASS